MPLVHGASKAVRNANIKREVAAGKPPKQAVAIAYATQRSARARRRSHTNATHRRVHRDL